VTDRADPEVVAADVDRRRPRALDIGIAVALVLLAIWAWRDPRPFGQLPIIGTPHRIHLCGRTYEASIGPLWTVDQLRAGNGTDPLIVDPWLHLPCVPGACTDTASDGPCATVLYVRAGRDALLAYELKGGP
jgi:hypothetical protein